MNEALQDFNNKTLLRMLGNVSGKKSLVMDSSISSSLSLVADFTLLREHGVDRIHNLYHAIPDSETQTLVFITRALPKNIHQIAKHAASKPKTPIHIVFVPKRTLLCDALIVELGIENLNVAELFLDIVQIETDVFSLEQNDSFRSLYVVIEFR